MVKAVKGTMVKCDASIKSMLLVIDAEQGHDMIVEDLDDEHVLVKDTKVKQLKYLLNQKINEVLRNPEENFSDEE